MRCNIVITQKDLDKNPGFFLYNAVYSDEICKKDKGQFTVDDIMNYFSKRNIAISREKVINYIGTLMDNCMVYETPDGYGIK